MDAAATLGIMEILGLAASASLLAGWRLYIVILGTGLAMRSGFLPLPEHLEALQVLANPWVLGIAGLGALAEFFADKVPWLDTIWDTVHTAVRPVGGAMLALAIVDPGDPAMQVIAFIAGGGGALLAHGGKAGTRTVINASPEPVSNIAMSTAEDVATLGLMWFVYEYPWASAGVAAVLLALAIGMVLAVRRVLRRIFRRNQDA
ncbi:putative membrane protein [Aurantiacibacter atlanticus]|uniref:Putative membrane protein n=1 Tax=Aurantiacibacter atlanticus TaxID=1648404 RepID=A0A0H4W0J8_9SPHN|nr:putative membrane protein [Aurantiacibacter atlanticus]